jgi:hypothetical protein
MYGFCVDFERGKTVHLKAWKRRQSEAPGFVSSFTGMMHQSFFFQPLQP